MVHVFLISIKFQTDLSMSVRLSVRPSTCVYNVCDKDSGCKNTAIGLKFAEKIRSSCTQVGPDRSKDTTRVQHNLRSAMLSKIKKMLPI